MGFSNEPMHKTRKLLTPLNSEVHQLCSIEERPGVNIGLLNKNTCWIFTRNHGHSAAIQDLTSFSPESLAVNVFRKGAIGAGLR